MAQRLIICFDPERLVTLPCPALYPELGRELLLLSGTPSEGDWARCATALAAANSDGVPVKLRLLVARADRKASVTSAQEAWVKAPEVVARRLQALLPALQLEWQHGEVAVSPVAQAPVVVICTRFERPAPADQSALAQRYLLPLALRFLLDSDVLLRGQFSSARELKQLIVTATGPDLMAATRDWARSLVRSKELLVRSRDRQMDAQCRVALYDDDVSALLTTVFRAPAIDKLTLGWFHHLQEEDRRIAAWFAGEALGVETALENFQAALVDDFKQAVQVLAKTEPTVTASAWYSNAAVPADAPPMRSPSCQAIRERIQSELAGCRGRPPVIEPASSSLHESVQEWQSRYRVEVIRCARRRPTARAFFSNLGVAGGLTSMATGFGMVSPAAAPVPWLFLAKESLVIVAALCVAAVLGAYLLRRRCKRALREAADSLGLLRRKHEEAASTSLASAKVALAAMVLGRNLEIVERACAEQSALLAQYEHHIDVVNSHLGAMEDALSGQAAKSDIPDEEIDPRQRPEDQLAYAWRALARPNLVKLLSGRTEMNVDEDPVTLGVLKRLAGLKYINLDYS